MKKLILFIAVTATALAQNIFAQDTAVSPVQKVITAYLNVKNALIKDNGDSVRAASKTLFNTINDVPMEKLYADQHKIWMQYSEKLSYDAEHMKQTDELEHQREHFAKLSINFYKMLKALNIDTGNLYYQFCPMANDGKGAYWISETEEIKNPYFGNKMLKCGSTKETIKAK